GHAGPERPPDASKRVPSALLPWSLAARGRACSLCPGNRVLSGTTAVQSRRTVPGVERRDHLVQRRAVDDRRRARGAGPGAAAAGETAALAPPDARFG